MIGCWDFFFRTSFNSQWCPVPNWGVYECDSAHRRSVAVLCVLLKIRCNPMHQLVDAQPGPYVPVRVAFGAVVGHRYTYTPRRCRTSQYHRTFVHLSVSLRNDHAVSVFDGVGLTGFKSRTNAFFYCLKLLYPNYCLLIYFPFLFFLSIGWYCGDGVFGLIGCISLSLSFALTTYFNINNNNYTSFHTHASLLTFFVRFFILFHSCCSHA